MQLLKSLKVRAVLVTVSDSLLLFPHHSNELVFEVTSTLVERGANLLGTYCERIGSLFVEVFHLECDEQEYEGLGAAIRKNRLGRGVLCSWLGRSQASPEVPKSDVCFLLAQALDGPGVLKAMAGAVSDCAGVPLKIVGACAREKRSGRHLAAVGMEVALSGGSSQDIRERLTSLGEENGWLTTYLPPTERPGMHPVEALTRFDVRLDVDRIIECRGGVRRSGQRALSRPVRARREVPPVSPVQVDQKVGHPSRTAINSDLDGTAQMS